MVTGEDTNWHFQSGRKPPHRHGRGQPSVEGQDGPQAEPRPALPPPLDPLHGRWQHREVVTPRKNLTNILFVQCHEQPPGPSVGGAEAAGVALFIPS
jgi:hypothetical protein